MKKGLVMYGPELKTFRRETLRIRQDQFAGILGLHPTTVSDWERDDKKFVPRYAVVLAHLMAEDDKLCRRLLDEAKEERKQDDASEVDGVAQ